MMKHLHLISEYLAQVLKTQIHHIASCSLSYLQLQNYMSLNYTNLNQTKNILYHLLQHIKSDHQSRYLILDIIPGFLFRLILHCMFHFQMRGILFVGCSWTKLLSIVSDHIPMYTHFQHQPKMSFFAFCSLYINRQFIPHFTHYLCLLCIQEICLITSIMSINENIMAYSYIGLY